MQVWFARQYKAYQPNTLLLDNALATMGAGGGAGSAPAAGLPACMNQKPIMVPVNVSVRKSSGLPTCPLAGLGSGACTGGSIPEVKAVYCRASGLHGGTPSLPAEYSLPG